MRIGQSDMRLGVLRYTEIDLMESRWRDMHADLLLTGGVVHTMDPHRPRAEAVAVTAGRISAVGGAVDVLPQKGPGTQVIDRIHAQSQGEDRT